MSIAKKVASQSGWFLVGNLYTLFVGFTFQIYLARQIGAEGLGLFGLLQAGVGALSGLLGLGIAHVMVRFIPEHVRKQEYAELHALVRRRLRTAGRCRVVGSAGGLSESAFTGRSLARLSRARIGSACWYVDAPSWVIAACEYPGLAGLLRHPVCRNRRQHPAVDRESALFDHNFHLGFHVVGYLWAVNLSMAIALVWMLFGIGAPSWPLPE